MNRFPSALTLIPLASIAWLVIFGCRTADLIAQAEPTATRTPTRTAPRPTFTTAPPTVELPPPTEIPPTPTQRPTAAPRLAPTRTKTPTPAPPPPTPDAQAGWYYHYKILSCVPDVNTRVQGTVYDNGVPVNGVTVRVQSDPAGGPFLDFLTGIDPADPNHKDASLQGKYRLGIQEGGRLGGYWYVFALSESGDPASAQAVIRTDDGPGCNTATIDFTHP
ncbi:MAG: hypothetical protein KGJ80_01880 [Chloroflexota bacterium]|nr:hypothetical protein [Chloroflexota bacterium]